MLKKKADKTKKQPPKMAYVQPKVAKLGSLSTLILGSLGNSLDRATSTNDSRV